MEQYLLVIANSLYLMLGPVILVFGIHAFFKVIQKLSNIPTVPITKPVPFRRKPLRGYFNGKSYMRGRAKASVKRMLGLYKK